MNVPRNTVGWWEGLERPLRHLPQAWANAIFAVLAATMVLSAYAVSSTDDDLGAHTAATASEAADEDDGDLALYQRISERVIAGEGYYSAALAEQRESNYPTRPFVTVRLPTLAMVHRYIGFEGARWLALGLLIATVLAFLWRFREDVLPVERGAAGVLLVFGGAAAITPEAGLIHELVAGLFLSLSLALHSPKNWVPSLVLAGLALAVRELAAPFVLLWLVFALVEKRWTEAFGVLLLLALFGAGMYLHYLGVEGHSLPDDAVSQGWDAMAGISLPLIALSKLTALLLLPTWLAAALVVLSLLGWISLGGRIGPFALIWFTGFFAAVALFARPENFYWVQLTLPAFMAGFAFAPRALADLYHSSRP